MTPAEHLRAVRTLLTPEGQISSTFSGRQVMIRVIGQTTTLIARNLTYSPRSTLR